MKFHWGDMLCNNKKHEKPQAWFTVDLYLGDRQRCPCNVITLCAVMCYHIRISLFCTCMWVTVVFGMCMFICLCLQACIPTSSGSLSTLSAGEKETTQPANSSSDFISVLTVYFTKEFIFLLWLLSAPSTNSETANGYPPSPGAIWPDWRWTSLTCPLSCVAEPHHTIWPWCD